MKKFNSYKLIIFSQANFLSELNDKSPRSGWYGKPPRVCWSFNVPMFYFIYSRERERERERLYLNSLSLFLAIYSNLVIEYD